MSPVRKVFAKEIFQCITNFQAEYVLTAFVEFIHNVEDPANNHYIGYRMLNGVWLQFDDERVYLLEGLEEKYNAEFCFYRHSEYTTQSLLPIKIPDYYTLLQKQAAQSKRGRSKCKCGQSLLVNFHIHLASYTLVTKLIHILTFFPYSSQRQRDRDWLR